MVAVHGADGLGDLSLFQRLAGLDELGDDAADGEAAQGAVAADGAFVVSVLSHRLVPILAVLGHQFLVDIIGLFSHGVFVFFGCVGGQLQEDMGGLDGA